MKPVFLILISLIILGLSSFKKNDDSICGRTGIKGHVYLVQGNQMPSPDQQKSVPTGMQTTLYIYELTNMSQVVREGESAFYKSINSRLIKQVNTGADGSFKVKLKPGYYSLFVKKGELFYANLFDGQNNIYPIEVKKGQMEEVDFQANYDAVY